MSNIPHKPASVFELSALPEALFLKGCRVFRRWSLSKGPEPMGQALGFYSLVLLLVFPDYGDSTSCHLMSLTPSPKSSHSTSELE